MTACRNNLFLVLALALVLGCWGPRPTLNEPEAVADPPDVTTVQHEWGTSFPHSARTATEGPLFQSVPPEETGVRFINRLDTDHPMRFLYHSAMSCGGVAIGDVDGDALPDVYLMNGPAENRLFRQTAPWRFEDITAQAKVDGGEAWAGGGAMVDIDNDGDLDIYVCNYDSPNQLFVNDGAGRFSEAAALYKLDLVDACVMPAFCDYDCDGDLDVYVLTNRLHDPGGWPERDPIVIKDGRPQLLPEAKRFYFLEFPTETGRYKIGPTGRADRLLCNNGDGTFTDVSNEAGIVARGDGLGADAGDLNGDGRLDLLVADMSATNHQMQKRTMGQMDPAFLITAWPRQYMRNALFLNTGTSRFQEAAYLAGLDSSDWTWSVKLADFDNDGNVDAFFTNGVPRNINDADLTVPQSLNGKTLWDLFEHAPPRPERNLAFKNKGDLSFDDCSKKWGLDHLGMSYACAYGDLDSDGDVDLVVANLDEPVSFYRNNSSQGHSVSLELRGRRSNRLGLGAVVEVESGDLRLVRQLTPQTGFMSSNAPRLHFGLGSIDQIERITIRWPSGNRQVVESLEADRHYVVEEPEGAGDRVAKRSVPATLFTLLESTGLKPHVEQTYDDYARQPLLPYQLSQLGPGHCWGDIDQDGDDDVYFSGAAGHAGKLYRNDEGSFVSIPTIDFLLDASREDLGALFFDADDDGDLDLYVVSGGYEFQPGNEALRDRLYLNDGKGTFSTADGWLPDTRDSGSCVAACDFDRDGDVDLFVGGRMIPGEYPKTPKSRLLRNDGGGFADVADQKAKGLSAAGMVTGAIWSDANDDGWMDLLVATEWGPVKYFESNHGELVERTDEAGLNTWKGWWNGIAGGDLDHDGDIDYVVSNFGLNTKYHASEESPALLYYGVFGDSKKRRLIEAEFELGTLFPVRGKSCSTNAMPFLGERFPTYEKFACASVFDIYSLSGLDQAQRFECNTLESGVFWNEGGTFDFEPLPRLAQISPSFGVIVCELNGDGNPDIFLAQNFFSPQSETGRMDGGLGQLLLGDGNGSFEIVPPAKSGLVAHQDCKSATIADINGDNRPDVVVGVNNGTPLVFTQTPLTGRSVAVRLVGRKENPVFGARVEIWTKDQPKQSAESYSSSGYISQSAADIYFSMPNVHDTLNLEVRWPDGTSSSHQFRDKYLVTIKQPEQ